MSFIMSIREQFEKREQGFVAYYGCPSVSSKGRLKPEEPCPIRTAFQVDRDRIVYANAFRRLKHKTQVFLSPLGDHYRTRMTHTLEVSEIARTIARALRLNEDLAEAIALGHDLGHPPFGHSGETALKEIYAAHFSHNKQSLRVVDVLEKNGQGLNLTREVRDGILKHSKGYGEIIPNSQSEKAATIEGQIVRIADIMAYLNHDLDDAIRSGVIEASQVPATCTQILGLTHSQRATTMIRDLLDQSKIRNEQIDLKMSSDVYGAMAELRSFLYDHVYRSAKVHKDFVKAKKLLSELYDYFLTHENVLKSELMAMEMAQCADNGSAPSRVVCDFIASITDRYALDLYTRLFFPSPLV
jgi:dGTPase